MTKTNGQILYEAANRLRGLDREWCDNNEEEKAEFEHMAEMVALAEREACAKVCDQQARGPECPERAKYCADAIRMRSNMQGKGLATTDSNKGANYG